MREPTRFPATAAVACTTEQNELGEGARWDAGRHELLRVDILPGLVFRDRVVAGGGLEPVGSYRLPTTVGALAPVAGDDGWLLAAGRGFVHLRPDGSHRTVAEIAPPGTRMNDAACDPQGRLWAGTVAGDLRPGAGSLYRFGRDGRAEVVLDGLHISNGIGWSPDGETLYFADSGPRAVHAFRFEPVAGTLHDGRPLVVLPDGEGVPDGLTVDADGHVWVAVYGGGCVHRYAPDGTLLEVHEVPAQRVTSCAFGGPELDWLYVTTATEHRTGEGRGSDPASGVVYRLRPGARGLPAAPFRPEPGWWSSAGA